MIYDLVPMNELATSRRSVIRACTTGLIALTFPRPLASWMAEPELVDCQSVLDHVMVGASDLDAGIAWFEKLTGVRPVFVGNHAGVGTRNAIVSLGPRQYLEILAPDPAQRDGRARILPLLRSLTPPRPIAWGARTSNIDEMRRETETAGIQYGAPTPGSRTAPNGRVFEWVNMLPAEWPNQLLPFFIQWKSPHPSEDAPAGCTLAGLRFESPDTDVATDRFRTLGLRGDIRTAARARMLVTLVSRRGRVEIPNSI
jgi:catechol 2,3-dioxygenase-like lactoylglutathione lyase family enzyme